LFKTAGCGGHVTCMGMRKGGCGLET
jgi:hypothetical protein